MKILFDNNVFVAQKIGGVSRYHIELAKQYVQQFDDSVSIPTFCVGNVYLADFLNRKLYDIKNSKIRNLVNRINVLQSILAIMFSGCDVVHLTWYHPRIIKACRNKKMVITIHDMIQEVFECDPVTVENKRIAMQNADGIIAISESTKKDILRFYPDIPQDKIQVIYHGTNQLRADDDEKAKTVLPEKYILYVGRREGYKNARLMMKSLAPLVREQKDLFLFFAGGGAFSDDERELLDQLEITSKVIQENVTDGELKMLYRHAICFVYPSKYEGFGFPILEAFDNNCPVVCSNTSSLPEVGGDAALYFSPGDSDELAKMVYELLSNPQMRKQCIARGNDRKKMFSWEKTAEETRNFYKYVIDQGAH